MGKSTANRGLSFEKQIEDKCEELQKEKIALIHKVPTDWKVLRKWINGKSQIYNAFPVSESKFVDFIGIYNNSALAIEAKETNEEKRFPFDNIKDTQIEFLDLWSELGGKGYYIIKFKQQKKMFFIPSEKMHDCIKNIGRKSAPYQWFLDNCIELDYKELNFIDYIN